MSQKLGIEVVPADSAQGRGARRAYRHVITKSADPVLKGEWLEPGQHINAAGSNAPPGASSMKPPSGAAM